MTPKTSRKAGAASEPGNGRKTYYVSLDAAAVFDAAVEHELHTRALNPAPGLENVPKHEIIAALFRIAVKHRDELDEQIKKDRKQTTTRNNEKG